MQHTFEIENIEELRRGNGIDDAELREEICCLQVGDLVKLTFLMGGNPPRGETVAVRILSIEDGGYRGKLTRRPVAHRSSKLRAGTEVSFTQDHIHSIVKTAQGSRR